MYSIYQMGYTTKNIVKLSKFMLQGLLSLYRIACLVWSIWISKDEPKLKDSLLNKVFLPNILLALHIKTHMVSTKYHIKTPML